MHATKTTHTQWERMTEISFCLSPTVVFPLQPSSPPFNTPDSTHTRPGLLLPNWVWCGVWVIEHGDAGEKKKKTALLSAVVKPPLIFFLLCWLQELELRWQEYYELVTLLLQWIRHHVTIFEERKFPGSYEEIEVRWYPDLMFLFLTLWVFLQEKQCSS